MQRERVRRLIPLVLAATAAALLAIVAPEIYTGTFSDGATLLRVVALFAVLGTWVLVIRRFVSDPVIAGIVAFAPVVAVVGFLMWPYLRPATEVDEAFPPVTTPAQESTTSTTTAAPTTTADDTESTATTAPSTTTSSTTSTTTTTTTVPPEPVELRRASFQGLTGHRGDGDAAVYRLADDSILLRFEEVDIGSGPDLEVWLVPGEDRRGLSGGIHVAQLTAERGNQNYTVPDGVDLTTGTWTVLVWCETFAVEVANATLT